MPTIDEQVKVLMSNIPASLLVYLDGRPIGRQWIPGGEPVTLSRNLLVGEDAKRASDEQLDGQVDDLLVYGRALKEGDIAKLAASGAAIFFQLGQ